MSFKKQSLIMMFLVSLAVFATLPSFVHAQTLTEKDDMLEKIQGKALAEVLAEYNGGIIDNNIASNNLALKGREIALQRNALEKELDADISKLRNDVRKVTGDNWFKAKWNEVLVDGSAKYLDAKIIAVKDIQDNFMEAQSLASGNVAKWQSDIAICKNYIENCKNAPETCKNEPQILDEFKENKKIFNDIVSGATAGVGGTAVGAGAVVATTAITAVAAAPLVAAVAAGGVALGLYGAIYDITIDNLDCDNLIKQYNNGIAKAEQAKLFLKDNEKLLKKILKNYEKYEKLGFDIQMNNKNIKNCAERYFIMIPDKNGENPVQYNFCKTKDGDYLAEGGVSQGCMPLPLKLAEFKQCIFCPLFLIVYNAGNAIGANTFAKVALPMSNVMLLAFAIYIAFKTMVMVSGFTKQDSAKYITEMLIQSFKILLAYLCLTNMITITDFIISPILGAGLEFGSAMLTTKTQGGIDTCKNNFDLKTTIVDGRFLGTALYIKLECFIKGLEDEISLMKAIGSTLMCVSRKAAATHYSSVAGTLNIPDFGMFFQGLIVYIFGWLLLLSFSFYLIDATVRIGIVAALSPFLIACWPFEQTKKYASTGWTMIMNTFFTYVFMGIIIRINLELAMKAMSNGKADSSEMMSLINGNDVARIKEILDIGGSGILILIGCCLFGFKLTGKAGDLAGQLAGGGGAGGGIAPAIATTAYSAATEVAKAAGGAAIDGVKGLAAGKGEDPNGDTKVDKVGGEEGGEKGGEAESSKPVEPKKFEGSENNLEISGDTSGGDTSGGDTSSTSESTAPSGGNENGGADPTPAPTENTAPSGGNENGGTEPAPTPTSENPPSSNSDDDNK